METSSERYLASTESFKDVRSVIILKKINAGRITKCKYENQEEKVWNMISKRLESWEV